MSPLVGARALATAVIAIIGCAGPAGAGLSVHASGRYLVRDGTPFFLTGDAAWSLMAQPTTEEALLYLDDRAARGFNLLLVNLIEHEFATNAPADIYGEPPFTGAPFVTPNEAYFAHADSIVAMAEERDIVLLLAPLYLGYGCGSQGWCQEVQAASLSDLREWGRYVGARYAGYDNIVWIMGGDTDPTPVADEVREVIDGIRELDPDRLMTTHNQPETQATTPWPGESWLTVNSIYTYASTLYQQARTAYETSPVMPYFLLESAYENEHGVTAQELRAQSYWAALSGAFGHVFGNCPIWHFGSVGWCGLLDWEAELGEPGSTNMTYYRNLFESRRWTTLLPDFDTTILIAGGGTWGSTDHATAASASDGSSIIAYLPSARSVTVDVSTLGGDAMHAWWYDPATGTPVDQGIFPRANRAFTPPGGGDWVLVIDDDAVGFPPPGTVVTVDTANADPWVSSDVAVEAIAPNPATGTVTVRYRLGHAAHVRVAIVAPDGRLVAVLGGGHADVGPHHITWDGRDLEGRSVASGLYFVFVDAGGESAMGKVVWGVR